MAQTAASGAPLEGSGALGGGSGVPGGREVTAGSWGRLRAVNRPVPARVRVGVEGAPATVEAGKRWRPVEGVQEQWRVDEGWWSERPVSRMYWRLVLAGGSQITVYEDLADKSWWVQRA